MNKHSIKKKQYRNAVTKRKNKNYGTNRSNANLWHEWRLQIQQVSLYIYIVLTGNSSPPFFPSKRYHDSIFTYHDSGVGRYQIWYLWEATLLNLEKSRGGGQPLFGWWSNLGKYWGFQLPTSLNWWVDRRSSWYPWHHQRKHCIQWKSFEFNPPPQKFKSEFTPEKLRLPIGKGSFEPTTIFQG